MLLRSYNIPPTFRPPCVECISLVRHLNADSQYFCQYSQDHASNVIIGKEDLDFSSPLFVRLVSPRPNVSARRFSQSHSITF